MPTTQIIDQLKSRFQYEIAQTRLVVDYYRIRRKLSFPLPLTEYPRVDLPVPGIAVYPWTVWLSWRLQERAHVLAHFAHEPAALDRLSEELTHMAAWPTYRDSDHPGLPQSHFLNILLIGLNTASLSTQTHNLIKSTINRIVDQNMPILDHRYAEFPTIDSFLSRPDAYIHLFNIGLISTFALARAATTTGHEAATRLNQYAHVLAGSFLNLGTLGYTEAVSYDGYVADFLLDWLATAPEPTKSELIAHPRWQTLAKQSLQQACPGEVINVAALGDVEALEMTFHLSALAKLQRLRPLADSAWLLKNANPAALSTQTLVTQLSLNDSPTKPPQAGPSRSNIGPVLRSGWSGSDLAAAISAQSPYAVDHLQADAGTIVIGAHGRWLITDPGYQQYMKKSERGFTLGAQAHNTPTVSGQAQSIKAKSQVLETGMFKPGIQLARIDLTACYDPTLNLKSVVRSVYLLDKNAVIVIDKILAHQPVVVGYNWHGHPESGWNTQFGSACLHIEPDVTLWITLLNAELQSRQIDRLPGSRGQLTLSHTLAATASSTVTWAFNIAKEPLTDLAQIVDSLMPTAPA